MLTAAVTLCVLAAAPAQEPVKLAATTFNVIDIPATRADFFTDHFADRLSEQGLKITTPREMASVIGLERQKELLGCTDASTSCLAEIANALGVDGVVMGDIANLSGKYQVNVKVVGATNGQKLAAFSGSASSEGEVLDVLGKAAQQIAHDVNVAMGRAVAPVKPSGGLSRGWFWAPAAVGAVALGVGAFGLVSANAAKDDLETKTFAPGDGEKRLQDGQTMRTLGYVGIGVGAAAAVGAVAIFALGEPPPVTPSVTVSSNGATVGIAGALPW